MLVFFCNICIAISLLIKYDIWIQWCKSVERFSVYENIFSSGEWRNLLLEMVLQLIAPYSFLQGYKYVEYVEAFNVTIRYEINEILLVFSFVRFYMLVKMLIYYKECLTPRSLRVCQMNGCESDITFAIKSLLKSQPANFVFMNLLVMILIFGYMLHVLEGPMTEVSGQNYRSMISCMWNVIITLSTVGYGELYPKTLIGRFIGILICFYGATILSLLVVTITDCLEFSKNEDKSFSLLINLHYKKMLKI